MVAILKLSSSHLDALPTHSFLMNVGWSPQALSCAVSEKMEFGEDWRCIAAWKDWIWAPIHLQDAVRFGPVADFRHLVDLKRKSPRNSRNFRGLSLISGGEIGI